MIDLDAIHPRHGAKFSPNLHAWLRKRLRRWTPDIRVYRDRRPERFIPRGQLHIGFMFDGDLQGARLFDVLCEGARVQEYSYTERFDEVEGFWERYAAIGRCAIDPEHGQLFVGGDGRYVVDGDVRTCTWCGVKHRRERYVVTRERERWVSEATGEEAA